jgi:type IV secretory pathway VirB10-like protein
VTPGVASLRTPPAPAPVAAGAAAPAAPPPWAPTQVAAPPAIGLAREVELIDRAMAALRGGDPAEALRTVRRHAAETAGHGQLAEDAAAIEIEALCQLHDPSTNRQLEVFDARFPRSAQRSRLTSQCP